MVTIYILPSTFLRIHLNFLTFTLFSFRCSTVSTNLSRHVNRICVPSTFVSAFSTLSTEGGQKDMLKLLRVWEKNLWSALLTVSYFFSQFTQVRPLLYHHAALFHAIIVWNQLHICEFIFRLILEQLPLSEHFHIVHCATAKLLLCRLFFFCAVHNILAFNCYFIRASSSLLQCWRHIFYDRCSFRIPCFFPFSISLGSGFFSL